MHVTGAIGHEHHQIVAKRILSIFKIEDALPPGRIKFSQTWPVKVLLRIAGLTGPAGTASLEIDQHLTAIAWVDIKSIRTLIGARSAIASRDLLPDPSSA